MKAFLFLVLLFLVLAIGQETVLAQSKSDLVGTWKLLSVSYVMNNGQTNKEPYGPHPTGLITYTADDRMMAMIAFDGRKSTTTLRHQRKKEPRLLPLLLPTQDVTRSLAIK